MAGCNRRVLIRTSLVVAFLLPAALRAAESIEWRHDYSRAFQEAKSSGRLLVINVHAAWCGPCQRLEQTTFRDATLTRIIRENCVAVSLDADQHAAIVQSLPVRAYPTQLFVTAEGKVAGKIEGFVEA